MSIGGASNKSVNLTVPLTGYRSACLPILVWLHRSRIPIAAVDTGVLSRILERDCVCPGPFERPRKRIARSCYVYPFEAFLRFLAVRGNLPITKTSLVATHPRSWRAKAQHQVGVVVHARQTNKVFIALAT